MKPSESSDRLERVKDVLAKSHPKVAEKDHEALPASVLQVLRGKETQGAGSSASKGSLWQRLVTYLSGPHMMGVGAAAVLVLATVFLMKTGDEQAEVDRGQTMRSGNGEAEKAPIFVLSGMSQAQVEGLRSSGYFREEQLLEILPRQSLDEILTKHQRPNLILMDGKSGTMSAPYAVDPVTISLAMEGEDLASIMLDFLSQLPKGEGR